VLWALVVICWVTRRVARGITVQRVAQQRAATFSYWRRWLVTPVLFGITVWLCTTRAPTYVGFWVSKPWLDRAVADVRASGEATVQRRVLGVYAAKPSQSGYPVGPAPGGTYIELGYQAGFLYRDDGSDPRHDFPDKFWTTRRLSPHWFLFEAHN
jgi:hypothetical protein